MILTLRDIKYLKEKGYKGSYLDVNDHLSKMPYGGEVSGGDEDPLLKKMLEKNTVVAESTLSRPTTQQQKVQETQIKRELDFQNPNLSETEFRERNAGVSRHRYQYDSNPEYKARVTQQAGQLAKTQGLVDYPNTSFLSKNYSGNPNLVFATPNQQDNPEALKSVEQFNMDLIASVLPIPGEQFIYPVKGAKTITNNWNKYITQEEKVSRMLAQSNKIKKNSIVKLTLQEELKLVPNKISTTKPYKTPGTDYDSFIKASENWKTKRYDSPNITTADLGAARTGDYWGISKDFNLNKFSKQASDSKKIVIENTIKNHELDHYLYSNSKKEFNDIIKAFDVEKFGVDKKYLMGKKSHIAGDELRARMAQLMDYYDFKVNPKTKIITDFKNNSKFTQWHLDYARKNYIKDTGLDNSMTSFFNAIKDDKKFLKVMNKTALSVPPIALYSSYKQDNTD